MQIQKYILQKILQISVESIKIRSLTECEKEIVLTITGKHKYQHCPACGKRTKKLQEKRLRYQKLKHISEYYAGKRITVVVGKRKFRCQCGKRWMEAFGFLKRYQRRTEACNQKVIGELKQVSIAEAARRNGLSIGSLWYYLSKIDAEEYAVKALKEMLDGCEDIILGVDEHSFSGRKKYVLVITNVKTKKLLAILPTADKETFKVWLKSLPDSVKKRIKALNSDMKIAYLNAGREVLGNNLDGVTDSFHLVQEANTMVDDVRQCIYWQEKLNNRKMRATKIRLVTGYENLKPGSHEKLMEILLKYPSLKEAWLKKEVLRSILKDRHPEDLEDLIVECLASKHARIRKFGKTLNRWKKEILNIFIYRTSNAFTEGINNKCKVIKRTSYGFKKEANYIKKLYFSFL